MMPTDRLNLLTGRNLKLVLLFVPLAIPAGVLAVVALALGCLAQILAAAAGCLLELFDPPRRVERANDRETFDLSPWPTEDTALRKKFWSEVFDRPVQPRDVGSHFASRNRAS